MAFADHFPIWDKLTVSQQNKIKNSSFQQTLKKGTIIYNHATDCLGILLIRSGQLRIFMISEEGREFTLYRLFEMDMCLFSASCAMQNIQFEVTIEAEKDSEVWIIPPDVYKKLMEESAPVANYTNDVMASRFSEVVWLMDQIMWKNFDKRLAGFLLEECILEDTNILKITHERIGNHMGSAREVVTRMLRYFQNEDMIKLSRGTIEIIDKEKLQKLIDA